MRVLELERRVRVGGGSRGCRFERGKRWRCTMLWLKRGGDRGGLCTVYLRVVVGVVGLVDEKDRP